MIYDTQYIQSILKKYSNGDYTDEDLMSSLDSIAVMITELELMHIREFLERKNAEIESTVWMNDRIIRRKLILQKVEEISYFLNELNNSK